MLKAKKAAVDMCSGPIFINVIRFTIPIVLMNALQLLYNAADTVIVGRFEGETAVAAVGATAPMINLIVNVFIGLSIGVNVCIGNYVGAGKEREAREGTRSAAILGLLCGVIVAAIGIACSELFLGVMKTPDNVMGSAVLYARIYFLGAPANLLYNFLSATLRARGDTKRPLYILAVCGALNVVLNVVLVAVFGLGVLGVALATVVSQYTSAILIAVLLFRGGFRIRLFSRWHGESILKILALGIPSGIQGSVFSLSAMIIQSAINSFDSAAIAGNTAAGNIDTFSYIAFNAFQSAAVAFIAQNYGAGNFKRIDKVFKSCFFSAVTVAIVTGWAVYLLSPILLEIYLPGNTEAIAFGAVRLRYICLPYFLLAMMDVTVGALRGLGSSVLPTVISIVGSCGLRILWIYTAFSYFGSASVLYMSFPLAWLVTFIALFISYRMVRNKKERDFISDRG